LHHPNQLLFKHFASWSGDLVGVEVGVGEGSKHIKPNHASDVQEWALVDEVGAVVLGMAGGDVMECEYV